MLTKENDGIKMITKRISTNVEGKEAEGLMECKVLLGTAEYMWTYISAITNVDAVEETKLICDRCRGEEKCYFCLLVVFWL